MSPINHHPDIQVSLPLAVEPPLNPGLARARQSLGQGGRGSSFPCALSPLCFSPTLTSRVQEPACCLVLQGLRAGVPSIWWPFLPPASPGLRSQSFPRSLCLRWDRLCLLQPLLQGFFKRWSLPCARMHSRSPPHYWPL